MIRYSNNPIIQKTDIPSISPHLNDVTSVFNPGAVKFGEKYFLMLRVQSRGRLTYFVMAESHNGIDFNVEKKIVEFKGIENVNDNILHIYDPRITKIADVYYILFAIDFRDSTNLGLAKTTDFNEFDFIGVVSKNNTRNGVLFPEIINGYYMRYERPNKRQIESGPRTGDTIYLSRSTDLLNWEEVAPVASGNPHYWDELIGSGPPPIKTHAGWLHIYHGIATHYAPIYQAGVMLFDLVNPEKVIARGSQNILEPREYYEMVGQVPNVVFPSGLIVEDCDEDGFATEDSEVKLYYGAADTSIGLAISTIGQLIKQCYE